MGEEDRSLGRPHAGHVLQVLDQHRHAGQWPRCVPAAEAPVEQACLRERLLGPQRHDGVQRGVEALDPIECHPHDLLGRDVPGDDRVAHSGDDALLPLGHRLRVCRRG